MTTVDVPGMGPVKKEWIYAGVALTVGIVGFAYYRRRTSAASAASTAAAPVAGIGTDTSLAAAQGQYAGAYGSPGYQTVDTSGLTGTLPPATNDLWSQAAITALEAVNYDPNAAATAIGNFINRQPLQSAQADMVRYAIAVLGPPPQGTYPVTLAPAQGGTTAGTTTPTGTGADSSGNELWSDFLAQQGDPSMPGYEDWGVIAGNVLGPGATKNDVYYESLKLQQLNPGLTQQSANVVGPTGIPGYVPTGQVGQVKTT